LGCRRLLLESRPPLLLAQVAEGPREYEGIEGVHLFELPLGHLVLGPVVLAQERLDPAHHALLALLDDPPSLSGQLLDAPLDGAVLFLAAEVEEVVVAPVDEARVR